MKNEYEEYFIENEKEWHNYQIGSYHVSSIGCDHQHLEPEEHYGPCLRKTFYNYTAPKEDSPESKGNLKMGNIIHEVVQKTALKNDPHQIAEFPLGKSFDNFNIMGSVDLVKFNYFSNFPSIKIKDIKSASQYTLPKNEDDHNPTYFDQMYIYSFWLHELILNPKNLALNEIVIVYVNKHNLKTIEIKMPYHFTIGLEKWTDYINRVKYLHKCLIQGVLPRREPNRWCKYCKYLAQCNENVLKDEDIPTYDNVVLIKMFEKETDKNAVWNGKETKGFQTWKKKMGYERD